MFVPKLLHRISTGTLNLTSQRNSGRNAKLITKVQHIFATNAGELDDSLIVTHQIDMQGHLPVYISSIRTLPAIHRIIDMKYNDMLHHGIVRLDASEYSSLVVIVKKIYNHAILQRQLETK